MRQFQKKMLVYPYHSATDVDNISSCVSSAPLRMISLICMRRLQNVVLQHYVCGLQKQLRVFSTFAQNLADLHTA
jgi:hypothetical protein